jgi:hypothetical protein
MMESPMLATAHLQSNMPLATVAASPLVREPASTKLARLVSELEPTTLAGLDAVTLLNRFDTKFLLSESQLGALLPRLAEDYLVLEVEGRRLHQYRTLYFDTPGFALYRRHHAGRIVRRKVRSRAYVDSGLSFFEVKAKDEQGRTIKHRLATDTLLTELSPDARALLKIHMRADERRVEPKLRNDFLRITLVGKACAERLTLDMGVQFDCDGRTAILPGVVIAEVKQSGADDGSPFMQLMRETLRESTSVSKYCVGVALLVQDIEHDAFEEKLRAFEQFARGGAEA